MRYNIAYKVVYVKNGKLLSANAQHGKTLDCLILEYEIGKVVTPHFGKLFIFPSKQTAAHYLSLVSAYCKVLKGIAKNPSKADTTKGVLDISKAVDCKRVESYWKYGGGYFNGWPTPNDTYFCDTFKPLKVM